MKLNDVKTNHNFDGFCIYLIKNLVNNKVYVGHTKRFGARMKIHQSRSKNKKYNYPLYNAIRKYGIDKFEVSIIIFGIKDLADSSKEEIKWIKEHGSVVPNGYNLTEGGEGCAGYKHTDEWKRQMSLFMQGKQNALGNKHTDDWKKEASKRHAGNKYATGNKHTEEWKREKSSSLKDNKHAIGTRHTEEWKVSVSQRMMGKQNALGFKHSDEFKEIKRQQLLLNNPNRKFTTEEKLKIFHTYVGMKNRSQRKIAKLFGCSQDTVKKIFATYKHLIEV